MTTHKHEFQSHNSPWTEMYDLHCQREDAAAGQSQADQKAEQQPTKAALADVYNRDETEPNSKRF